MKRRRHSVAKSTYRYTLPILSLVTVISAVLLWDYTGGRYKDLFRGYADAGKTGEVVSAFISDPAVLLTAIALVCFNLAAFAAVIRAIRARHSGAYFFLLLIIVNILVFLAIMIIAVREVAA